MSEASLRRSSWLPTALRTPSINMKSACAAASASAHHPSRVLGSAKILFHSEARPLNVQSLLSHHQHGTTLLADDMISTP
jgi:hypothetical protein